MFAASLKRRLNTEMNPIDSLLLPQLTAHVAARRANLGYLMTASRPSFVDRLAIVAATGLGVGFIPFAPGTFGSLWGPLAFWFVCRAELSLPVLIVTAIVFIAAGVPISTRAARALGKKDPGSVVYDEIAAFWIVFAPQLLSGRPLTPFTAIAGFVLFRIFDISKPFPCRRLEKLPDGAGIMADDLVAGAYAAACLYGLERYF